MGFLGRAKSMFQGRSTPATAEPVYFRVNCPKGHALDGRRTESYQALRCPHCGEGIFVLPLSPLPEPPSPPNGVRKRPTSAGFGEIAPLVLSDPPPLEPRPFEPTNAADLTSSDVPEATIEWLDDPAPARTETPAAGFPRRPEPAPERNPAPPRVKSPKPTAQAGDSTGGEERPRPSEPIAKPKPKGPPSERQRPRQVEAPRLEEERVVLVEAPTIGERLIRHKNPLIFTAVILIAAATIGIRSWRKTLEELPKKIETNRVEGLSKLAAGEFFVAKQLLGDAAKGVDALGGRFEGADAIRRVAKEAAIFADLTSEPLETIVEQAAKFQPRREGETVNDWFVEKHQGRSVILDVKITAVPPEGGNASGYDCDYRVYFGSATRPAGKGRIDFDEFELFEFAKPALGERKVLGARLASIRLDTGRDEWLVGLVPESGVFIETHEALTRLGWPDGSLVEESDK